MPKRLITALLGGLLTVALTAAGASAAAGSDIAAARAEAVERYSAPAVAKALTGSAVEEATGSAVAEGEEGTAEGGEGTAEGEACVGLDDPSLDPLFEQLNNGIDEIVEGDEQLAALDAKLGAAEERYLADLEAAESADDVKAAYAAFAAAVASWAEQSKARFAALKPQFGEVVAAFIADLVEAGVCEEDIQFVTDDLAGGQWFVDAWRKAVDLVAAEVLKTAAKERDDALENFPAPNPRPDDTLPPEGPGGPGLPDTGANTLPLLLAGLALISGGSTALLIARRRSAA